MTMTYEITDCGICLEPLEKTNVCITKCGHSFCLSCIIQSTNYKNCCPNCRTEIYENKNTKNKKKEDEEGEDEEGEDEEGEDEEGEDEEGEDEEREGEEESLLYGWVDEDDDCYHFPVVIDDIQMLADVIHEATGGVYMRDGGLGLILGFLSIQNDYEETKINLNSESLAEEAKPIIKEAIFIYKRSILLESNLQNKIK